MENNDFSTFILNDNVTDNMVNEHDENKDDNYAKSFPSWDLVPTNNIVRRVVRK